MTGGLRKRLTREQTRIYTDSHAAVVALGVSGTKSPLVADYKITDCTVGSKPGNINTSVRAKRHSVEGDYR